MTEAILASPEAMTALEEAAADLLRPSNDRRAQIKELLTNEADRAWIAEHVIAVHHVMDGGRNYVTIGLANDRDRPAAIELASRAQRLFEVRSLPHGRKGDFAADLVNWKPVVDAFDRITRNS